jgi:hypothetical protein
MQFENASILLVETDLSSNENLDLASECSREIDVVSLCCLIHNFTLLTRLKAKESDHSVHSILQSFLKRETKREHLLHLNEALTACNVLECMSKVSNRDLSSNHVIIDREHDRI